MEPTSESPSGPPPQSPRRPKDAGSPTMATVAWVATLVFTLIVVAIQTIGASAPAEPLEQPATETAPSAPPPPGMLGIGAKWTVFSTELTGTGSGAAMKETAVQQLEGMASGPNADLRIAIVAGELLGAERAIERLDELEGKYTENPQVIQDVSSLREIYSGRPVGDEVASRLRENHDWFGDLALVYGKDATDQQRAEVLAEAQSLALVFGLGLLAGGGAMVVGLGLLITGVVLLAQKKIRCATVPAEPGGSVGIETFALFLGGFILIQLVSVPVALAVGERAAGLLVWLLALVPLWPLLRGSSLAQWGQVVGWNKGRGVLREVGAGVVGYLAGMPIIAMGILCTLALMQVAAALAGPEGAPPAPSHPLPEQLAAGGVWVVISMYLLATVWAPVVEESCFRGALYSQLRTRFHPVLCGLTTGFIFAIVHPQGWIAIPTLTSIGFVFAMLREWRGSIIAPMVAHALNNGAVVTLLVLAFSV